MTRELDMDGVSDGEPCDVPLVSYPALSSAECPHSAVLGEAQAYMSVPEFYPREGPHYAIMFDADEALRLDVLCFVADEAVTAAHVRRLFAGVGEYAEWQSEAERAAWLDSGERVCELHVKLINVSPALVNAALALLADYAARDVEADLVAVELFYSQQYFAWRLARPGDGAGAAVDCSPLANLYGLRFSAFAAPGPRAAPFARLLVPDGTELLGVYALPVDVVVDAPRGARLCEVHLFPCEDACRGYLARQTTPELRAACCEVLSAPYALCADAVGRGDVALPEVTTLRVYTRAGARGDTERAAVAAWAGPGGHAARRCFTRVNHVQAVESPDDALD